MLHIEKSINELRQSLKKMTGQTLEMMKQIRSSITENSSAFENIRALDTEIDRLEKETDQKAVELLALINPRASDLRFVFSVIKVTVDLERIGDECKNLTYELPTITLPYSQNLQKLAAETGQLVEKAVESLLSNDAALAREIIQSDDLIDNLEKSIQKECSDSPGYILSARALERIGDHCMNIAENVIFTVEGVDIRHNAE